MKKKTTSGLVQKFSQIFAPKNDKEHKGVSPAILSNFGQNKLEKKNTWSKSSNIVKLLPNKWEKQFSQILSKFVTKMFTSLKNFHELIKFVTKMFTRPCEFIIFSRKCIALCTRLQPCELINFVHKNICRKIHKAIAFRENYDKFIRLYIAW